MRHNTKPLGVISSSLLLLLGVCWAHAKINVVEEVDKIEQHLGTLKAPPELINQILHQLQTQCEKDKTTLTTVNETVLNDTATCVRRQINETQLFIEIRQSIPEGNLDRVFHDISVKWPAVQKCFDRYLKIIDECWQKGDHVTKFIDGFVKFFCGDDNYGSRIAKFFAEGGMQCLEQHGDKIKQCIERKRPLPDISEGFDDLPDLTEEGGPKIPTKAEICDVMQELKECTTEGLHGKCDDPTPENLISSMIIHVGKELDCVVKDTVRSASVSSAMSIGSSYTAMILSTVLLFILKRFY